MKRTFDVIVSLLLLGLLGPIILLVWVLVRWKLGTPVLFRQQRPGLNAQPFDMLKFRTMTDTRDAEGKLLPDGERLTRFGIFLRSYSLDELPGLINVVKGEMSLVGPRPLLMQYVPLYNPIQSRRHEVRPGITGWAQVNGRNALSWEQKFACDVWYVDHRTFLLDIRILLRTALKVFRRDSINAPGEATMAAFRGNDADQ